MGRMIDADALMNTIIQKSYTVTDYWNSRDAGMFLVGIEQAINEQPIIEERKTGKWEQIEVSYFADMDDETKTGMAMASMFCPNCKRYHNEVYIYGNPTFGVNFCPNCGSYNGGEQHDAD